MDNIKFSADINKTLLPFVTVTEGTFKGCCFLLDTGSNKNILFSPTYERVKAQMVVTNERNALSGIEGKTSIASTYQANISFCGVEHKAAFLLVETNYTIKSMEKHFGFSIAGIIGITFMFAHRWIIDFVAQEVKIRPALILDCA